MYDLIGDIHGGADTLQQVLHEKIEPMLERESQHHKIVPAGRSCSAKEIEWLEGPDTASA
jgi:hypothetical protein